MSEYIPNKTKPNGQSNWKQGEYVSSAHMNHIEDGIRELSLHSSGVASIGGVTGDITLGAGLTINGHELSATGGGGGGGGDLPSTTTPNKLLVSTNTADVVKWTDSSTYSGTAGFLKISDTGVTSVDNSAYVLSINGNIYPDANGNIGNIALTNANNSFTADQKITNSNLLIGSNGTIATGSGSLLLRTHAQDSYKAGVYYSTPGNEAVVFGTGGTNSGVISWIFANADPQTRPAWTGLTPGLQIKDKYVAINKLIGSGTTPTYNLDVNGKANATELYENGVRVSTSNQKIKTDDTTFGDSSTVTIVAGSNVAIVGDSSNNTITISSSGSSGGMVNPMTTAGDLIVGGTNGAPSRFAKGANNTFLSINSSGTLEWTSAPQGTVKKVNNQSPDGNGNVTVGAANIGYSGDISAADNVKDALDNLQVQVRSRAVTNTSATKSVTDGSNTLVFGDNAFNSTPIPTNVAVTNADNNFSTTQTFKDVTLYSPSGDSPRLTFQRGTLTDTYNDWSIYDSGGFLYVQQRGSGSSTWETIATFKQNEVDFAKTLKQGGVAVVTTSGLQALTNKTYNGYTLADASAKSVDTSITTGSTSTNLPTSQAVASFVEGKGYVTSNQTIRAEVGASSYVSFGDNDVVTLRHGSNVTLAADSSAKTITISADVGEGVLTLKAGSTTKTFNANQTTNETFEVLLGASDISYSGDVPASSNVLDALDCLQSTKITDAAISSSSAGVALGGYISVPTITVTGGSVASGNTSVVTGGTVYTALTTAISDSEKKELYRTYACSSTSPYFRRLDGNSSVIDTITTDISTAFSNNNWGVLYEYFRQTIFDMADYGHDGAILTGGPSACTGLFVPYDVTAGWLSSNLRSYFLQSGELLANMDSFKVEALGGKRSSAECTMKFTLYTKDAKEYVLQIAASNDISTTYATTGWKQFANQTVKTSSITFSPNSAVEIRGGTNISVEGNSTNNTITISSTGGGQGGGQLYKYSMNLSRFDNTGTRVNWGIEYHNGLVPKLISSSLDTLPLVLEIYESNFNRLLDTEPFSEETIDDPATFVEYLNHIFKESTASGSTHGADILRILLPLCDKAYFVNTVSGINYTYQISNINKYVMLGTAHNHYNFYLPIMFTFNNNGTDTDRDYALNVNNSCTLTTYPL